MSAFKDTIKALSALTVFIGIFLLVLVTVVLWHVLGFIAPILVITFVIFILLQDPEDPPKS